MKRRTQRLIAMASTGIVGLALVVGVAGPASAALVSQQHPSCAASGTYYAKLFTDHSESVRDSLGGCGTYYAAMTYYYNGIKYWTGYASSTTDAIQNPPYSPGSNSRHKTSASTVVISLP